MHWERRLLALAHEPLRDLDRHTSVKADRAILEQAYERCTAITQEHSKTFFLASGLLPRPKRSAVRALYAFCRVTDDLVDGAQEHRLDRLEEWRERTLGADPTLDDPVALAWNDTMAQYSIPKRYAHQLIDGVARDLRVRRYASFDELAEYSYGVASTVGLMAMHIIGFAGPEAVPYAVKLGVALQVTNILRDIREDWDIGRLYLPQDELAGFGLSESDIAAHRLSDRWRAFVAFQVERNRRLYAEAMPGISLLHRDGRFAIAAAAELYRGILDDIVGHDGDVFTRRAHLSGWGKLRRLPGIWWHARAARA